MRNSKKEVTSVDLTRLTKMRSADYLYNSLAAGSKNRLNKYRNNLSVTRGRNAPLFDNGVKKLMMDYAKDKQGLEKVIEYLNQCKDADGNLFSRNLKIYEQTSKTFEKFSETDYTSFRWNKNYIQSLKELKADLADLSLTPLKYCIDKDIIDAIPKASTHSGWTYIETGLKNKGENMENILDKFSKELDSALLAGTMNKPILVGFRTQASGEFEDDGTPTNTCKHKTRVVCMYDLMSIILELKYAKPFQKVLARKPYYAGGKDPNDTSSIIGGYRARSKTWWSIDYSSYDMTLSSWLIEDVFDCIKEAFQFVDDREWNIIVHDFIHKDFVINEGVVHSDKGVPSGSMFTQIVDSLANMLMVKTYFASIGSECNMITMGDDNLIFSNLEESRVEELASYLNKNFGVMVNADKSSTGTRKKDPEFLSRFWRHNGQWRHPNLLISRMLFPERFRDYSHDVKPEHVIFAFILTYRLGMAELMDINAFMRDYPISRKFILETVDIRYLPGALAFIREYT